jgi:hypothetical protein
MTFLATSPPSNNDQEAGVFKNADPVKESKSEFATAPETVDC